MNNPFKFINRIRKKKVNFFPIFFISLSIIVSMNLYADQNFDWTSIKHQVKFEHLTTKHGLSQSSVLCIVHDSRGFMWFGTEDGLNMYDGYEFKIFRPEPENPYSITNNRIFALHEDREGILWIGTNGGGLNKFDHKTGRFYAYRESGSSGSISADNISTIYEDRKGNLWFGTIDMGLNKLPQKEKHKDYPFFISYIHDPGDPNSLSNNHITSVYEDHRDTLWIGTEGGGLNRLVPGKYKHSSPTFISYKTGIYPVVTSICEDQKKNLWIGTKNGLYRFNRKIKKFSHYPANPRDPRSLSHNYITKIYRDRVGICWICTDGGGLNRMIPGEKEDSPPTFIQYRYNPYSKYGLFSNAVETVCEDRSGVLWIGLYTGGLNKLILRDSKDLNREQAQFSHIQFDPEDPLNSLSHNSINTIYVDKMGALWVGTDGGGLNKIVPGKKKNTPLTYFHYKYDPFNLKSLSNDNITAFYEDRSGTIWVGTYLGGLNKLVSKTLIDPNPEFKHYKSNPKNPRSISHNFVYSITEGHKGFLWIGTVGGGLNRFDIKKEIFTQFKNNPQDTTSLSVDYIMSLFIDSSNTLWIGTTYGLNQFDYEKEIFTRHFHDPADNNSISSNFINSIFQDSSGTLWIGTDGGGLNKMIPGSKKGAPPRFINYTVKNGLPNNVVLDILQDDQGNLWLSTNNGLSRFSLKDTTFRNYNITDGLQDNEFNDGAAFKSKSGELFFGGDNGVNIFYPENLKDNRYIPPIVITDFQIFNQSVPVGEWSDGISILEETITETKRITLSNKYNIFSFQFSALNYISTEKNQYAYKMEGLEKNWNYVGDRRFVTYTTLPPGDYVFSVKGSNNNGFWNEEGTHLKIRITPPFWQTWWFRILVITIILALIVVFYRIRTFHIKQTNIQLEEKNILLNKQIQERKKVEEALKESEAKYRSLFINIPDPILIFHRETNQILDCNQAALDRYGYTLEELQSIGPDDLRPYDELKKEVPDTEIKGDNPYLYSHITKTGERLEVQVHTAPVEYKKQMAYISIIRDITQQKQLEQQLYQAQKMESIGNLAGGIAHDFNNLLTAIIGHAELALMKMEKESPFISDINAVLTSGKRASDLTGQLLAFSRKQIIKPRIIDINSLILDLDTMLHRLIGEDISIKKTLKPDIMRIKADPGQIEQILVNIIINACDAINEQTYKAIDKKITIETNQVYLDESYTQELIEITPGQYISIAVSDTGTGMSKKTKGQIFDPFFTTKKEGKGTGLGLSTVYGIVKQNRGNIYVYSEPGKGSTIKIYWPATVEQETIDTIEKTDKKSFTGSETILFVEDDKGVRDFGVAALKELGYNVFEAQTGRRAITLIKEKKLSFDLLITDLVMPEMNGKELADTIKSMFPDVKVLYTSGYTDNHIVHRGELAEGVHFLQKPYSIKSLLSMIRNIFDHPES